jgi:large subunit ribosomal protein L21
MKYAIVQIGGKQFLLQPEQWYDIDLVKNTVIGDYLLLNKVLLFKSNNQIQVGTPFLFQSQIPVKIIQEVKGKKITVLKTKPKKKYTRTKGHRTMYTRIKVNINI